MLMLQILFLALISTLCSSLLTEHRALLDRNDTIVAKESVSENSTRCPDEASTGITTLTPNSIVEAINETFISSDTFEANMEHVNVTTWYQLNDLSNSDCVTKFEYCLNNREPITLTQDPCLLTPGQYNWAITDDSQLTFAYILNDLEFGCKHLAIAYKRGVYSAGEFNIYFYNQSITMIAWNLDSGSYIQPYWTDKNISLLINATQYIWNHTNCTNRFLFDSGEFTFNNISNEYINKLCNNHSRLNDDSDWYYLPNNDTSPCEVVKQYNKTCINTQTSSDVGVRKTAIMSLVINLLFIAIVI